LIRGARKEKGKTMKRPDNEITSKDQIDPKQDYTIYKLDVDNIWRRDCGFKGAYVKGSGEFFLTSLCYAVIERKFKEFNYEEDIS